MNAKTAVPSKQSDCNYSAGLFCKGITKLGRGSSWSGEEPLVRTSPSSPYICDDF